LEAGCNILVEKPITLTLNDCDKILDVAQRMKKEVCVIHSSLFFPSMIRASHKLSELGTLDSIRVLFDAPERFLVAKWIKEMPAGIMDEVMPHVAYIVNAFVQPKDATVFRSKSKWSGHEHCTIVFENEIPCIVDINFGEDWEFKVFIEGSRKSMQIDILNQFLSVKNNRNIPRNKFGVLRNWSEKLFADVNQIFSNTTDSFRPFGHEYVIKKYISHLLDSNNPTPVSAEDIREVVRITQMVNKKFVEET
jgi:predicted dehydrogenase